MSQALIDKIMATAEKEAEQYEADCRKRAAESEQIILKKATNEADAIIKRATDDGEQKVKAVTLTSRLDARKAHLKAKKDALSRVYASALGRLCSLDGEEWQAYVMRLIVNNAPCADVVLSIPERDAAKYTKEYIGKIEKGISEKTGAPSTVTLDGEYADIAGGAIIHGDICDVDVSFESVVDAVREQSENDVCEILFK